MVLVITDYSLRRGTALQTIGEELVKHAKSQGLDFCSMRIFVVYGPNMDTTLDGNGRVFPNFFNAMEESESINIEGDGKQTACHLCSLTNVEAIVGLMEAEITLPNVVEYWGRTLFNKRSCFVNCYQIEFAI